MSVSVAMLVREPEIERLSALVELLREVSSEFVIVDTGSKPETIEKMRSWKQVQVIEAEWQNDFAYARNLALPHCTGDWILVLDTDELPTFKMLQFVKDVDSGKAGDGQLGWLFWTVNFWDGVEGPPMEYHWHVRLFKNHRGWFYRPIHELVMLDGQEEAQHRESQICPKAPRDAKLIHSKGAELIRSGDQLYASIGEVSK